jgi:hypothetical protein
MISRHSLNRRGGACMIAALICAAAPAMAADDEMVVIDQRDLSSYWRAEPSSIQVLERTADQPEIYGCVAIPFVIDTAGRVSPVLTPLMVAAGQSGAAAQPDTTALIPVAIGSLPRFESTWDKPLSDSIYSSHAVALADARIRTRLNGEQWADLQARLERQCRIDGLADRVDRKADMVTRTLPPRPEQLLATPE